MSAAFNLFRLQQVDSSLSQVRGRRAMIEAALGDDAETRSARDRAHTAHGVHLMAENVLREAEYETRATRTKIEQVESSLYTGRVSNPKELQDLQKDSEFLRRHLAILEDRQLEAMLTVEEAQNADVAARSMLEETLAVAAQKARALQAEAGLLDSEIERMETERQAIRQGLDAQSLAHYESLKADKRGVAVASLFDGACSACGAPLPPSQRQAAHIGGQMIHCPSCGRLLYAG